MYAIVETGGKQYRVKPGDTIAVERIAGEPGEVLDLGRVLLLAGNGDSAARIGSPGVEGAVVRAEVVEHARAEKIVVFRYKSKVRYRRKTGHRQALTRLRITDILLNGRSTTATAEARAATESAAAAAPADEVAQDEATPARRRRTAPTTAAEAAPAEAESTAAEAEMPASASEAGPTTDEEESKHTEA